MGFKLSSALVEDGTIRRAWLGARRVPLADLVEVERGEGPESQFLVGVLRDGQHIRLLKHVGTMFDSRRSIDKLMDRAVAEINIARMRS